MRGFRSHRESVSGATSQGERPLIASVPIPVRPIHEDLGSGETILLEGRSPGWPRWWWLLAAAPLLVAACYLAFTGPTATLRQLRDPGAAWAALDLAWFRARTLGSVPYEVVPTLIVVVSLAYGTVSTLRYRTTRWAVTNRRIIVASSLPWPRRRSVRREGASIRTAGAWLVIVDGTKQRARIPTPDSGIVAELERAIGNPRPDDASAL